MRYSVDVFLNDKFLNSLKTDSLAEAYKDFAQLIDLVEEDKVDTIAIFDEDMKIIAQVSSFDF